MLIDGTGNVSVYNTPSSNNHVANKAYVDNSIPIGGIIMWSGTIATIPVNWRLCNGGTFNGRTTPDLTNKFIVGVSTDIGGTPYTTITTTYTQSGGSKDAVLVKHNHGGNTNNGTADGGHSHSVSGNIPIYSYASQILVYNQGLLDLYSPNTNTSTSISLSSGSAASTGSEHKHAISNDGEEGTNKNLPPYYALAFIMRVF
jgi:hypothetical protein